MKATPKPDAQLAKWCDALTAAVVIDDVPNGWHTAADLAEKLDKPASTIGKLLLAAVRAGKCEVKKFRINCGAVTRPVPHYRLK
jgi:response regulator of citrate/malate metabolism